VSKTAGTAAVAHPNWPPAGLLSHQDLDWGTGTPQMQHPGRKGGCTADGDPARGSLRADRGDGTHQELGRAVGGDAGELVAHLGVREAGEERCSIVREDVRGNGKCRLASSQNAFTIRDRPDQ
jgi:hypothetical protein